MSERRTGQIARFGLLLGFVVVALHGGLMWNVQQRYHGNDFGKLYYGVRAWQRGESLYGVTPASVIPVGEKAPPLFFRNLNPPHVHVILWPLAGLPLPVATFLWCLLNLAALGASLRVIAGARSSS